MEVITQSPTYWYLMWVVLAVAILVVVGLLARRRAMSRFASTRLLKHLAPHISESRKRIKAILFVAALAGIVAGLVDIRWGKKWTDMPQRGVDIIFALDVSRSMQAQDVSPNRLTRAKEYIRDMMEEMGGDRVGLVTFAGKAKQIVPLTSNYSDVKIALEEVSTQSISRGGSLLGDAIRTAAESFVDKIADHKAIVVITDGEDHESYPIEAAKKTFKDKGIRIYTIGLGDRKIGARIAVKSTAEGIIYLKHNGQEVWSKMDGAILEQTALAGGGAYIPAGTKHVDIAKVYDQHIRGIQQREFTQARAKSYIPRFQWFLGAAVLLLLIESLIPTSRRPNFFGNLPTYTSDEAFVKLKTKVDTASHAESMNKSWETSQMLSKSKVPIVLIFCGMVTVLTMSASAWADETKPTQLVLQGNQALAEGDADKALTAYKAAQEQVKQEGRDLPQLVYNQAVALYRKGEYKKAQEHLREALTTSEAELEAKARFNMGNCSYAMALPLAKKDKKQAIENLVQAIKHYRDALAIDTNDADARANIELAQLMKEELKKQQKQEDKKKKDKKQDQQDNKQQKKNQNNKDKQEQKDKKQQDQNKQQQSNEKDQKQQKQDQKKTGENKKQEKQQSKQNKKHPGAKPEQQKAQPKKMSPEEAAKLLQAVRDKNLKRRKEKLQKIRVIEIPVEKDW